MNSSYGKLQIRGNYGRFGELRVYSGYGNTPQTVDVSYLGMTYRVKKQGVIENMTTGEILNDPNALRFKQLAWSLQTVNTQTKDVLGQHFPKGVSPQAGKAIGQAATGILSTVFGLFGLGKQQQAPPVTTMPATTNGGAGGGVQDQDAGGGNKAMTYVLVGTLVAMLIGGGILAYTVVKKG